MCVEVCFYLLVGFVGIFGNFNIVWATARKNSLHSTCNILIASAAFCEIVHQSAHFAFAFYVFSGRIFTTLEHCFFIQLVPLLGLNAGTFLVLSVGVDRLFCVLKPMWYKKIDKTLYLMLHATAVLTFCIAETWIAYQGAMTMPNFKVVCIICEAYQGLAKDRWLQSVVKMNGCILLCYGLLWLTIYLKSSDRKVDKRIIRSLTWIMCLVLFGWFSAGGLASVFLALGWNNESMLRVLIVAGACINVSVSLDFFVYYRLVNEYRVAFRQQIRVLTCGRLFKDEKANVTTIGALSTAAAMSSRY